MVEAPVVPISPVIAVAVPWLVMPAPPPKTAKVDAEPRLGAAARTADLGVGLENPFPGDILQAATRAAIDRIAIPPRTLLVYDFIFSYLLVWIIYIIWPYVKYYLYIIYVNNSHTREANACCLSYGAARKFLALCSRRAPEQSPLDNI
jgi:hypothetical protein